MRVLILGQGGIGKSRWASFSQKPIFAACEPGIAAIADRSVPYANINTSQDMLDFLQFLKMESRQPDAQRKYQTAVIDTIDAYARKLKVEWMETNRKDVFNGREAWAFLEQKLNILLTRLMNLDMNVVMLGHLKDKVTRDDEADRVTYESMIRLQGSTADTIFDDFDLVGYMDSEYVAVDGKKTEKRYLTFKKTPQLQMLKDRMSITPERIPVHLREGDWEALFSKLEDRIAELKPGEELGEIPTFQPTPNAAVVTPELAPAGPLPAGPPATVPLGQLGKPEIIALIKRKGIKHLKDGTPIRGNTLKSELVEALEHHRRAVPSVAPPTAPPQVVEEIAGTVDVGTGEILRANGADVESAMELDAAMKVATEDLGAVAVETVVALPSDPILPTFSAAGTPAAGQALQRRQAQPPATNCEKCNADITPTSGQNPDYVRLARIKYREDLCNECFLAKTK